MALSRSLDSRRGRRIVAGADAGAGAGVGAGAGAGPLLGPLPLARLSKRSADSSPLT